MGLAIGSAGLALTAAEAIRNRLGILGHIERPGAAMVHHAIIVAAVDFLERDTADRTGWLRRGSGRNQFQDGLCRR